MKLNHEPGSIPMSLLCTICDRDRGERVVHELEQQDAYFNLAMLGHGTANSPLLGMLGLGNTEKTVFMSIMPAPKAQDVMAHLHGVLHLDKAGHGIAFTAQIYKGCYHKVVDIAHTEETEMENPGHDLVMIILNRGYTEEVMDVARAAGATGGTVLHARGCGLAGAEKFFGVTIQPEREILMIVASREESCAIMQAVSDKAGHETDAGAVSFSMPVDGVRGLAQAVEGGV